MHYITVEEIPTEKLSPLVCFLLTNILPLFYLILELLIHFMSQTFASKHDHKIIEVNKGGYSISLAGATISTNQIVRDVLISIQESESTLWI